MLHHALELASQGFAVFPLSPNSKIPPSGSQGVKLATKSVDDIKRIWLQYGSTRANIGVGLGACSGLVAIDLDRNHGATDEDLQRFPRTWTVKTRNGYHLYFKYPTGGVKNHVILPGTDKQGAAYLRSDGYYVVGPPSTVAEWEYRWHEIPGLRLAPGECELAELPDWCLGQEPHKAPEGQHKNSGSQPHDKGKEYGPNTRHAMFLKTATAMRRRGCSEEQILEELRIRNATDCNPPKEDADQELRNAAAWAMKNVTVVKCSVPSEEGEYVLPLGHHDNDYFYTTSSNRQIVRLPHGGHSPAGLMNLMPRNYWLRLYPKGNGATVDWEAAGGELMDACRGVGIFYNAKVRGIGAWREGDELVLHLGDRLLVRGQEVDLNHFKGKNIYALGVSVPSPHAAPLTAVEAGRLIQACSAPNWKDKSSGMLLAGGLSVLRLCGALPWRPMLWLTGGSGAGKSTLLEYVVHPMAGAGAVYAQSNTTEAGIRQELQCDSRPVMFDEAEVKDRRSQGRMQNVLELIRQASSSGEGRILKGTADGKGHNFKVNSAFFLASIRVSLTEEADLNRFTVLELDRAIPERWPEVRKLMDLEPEFGDRLWARMVKLWPTLMKNRAKFEDWIAERATRRTAQQYSILLAGYWALMSDTEVSEAEGRALVDRLPGMVDGASKQELPQPDEQECLTRLLMAQVRVSEGEKTETMSVHELVSRSKGNPKPWLRRLAAHGLGMDTQYLYVIGHSSQSLETIYRDSKWAGGWTGALGRLEGAQRGARFSFAGDQQRCVRIPLSLVTWDETVRAPLAGDDFPA